MAHGSARRNDMSTYRELHIHLQRQFNGTLTRLEQEIEGYGISKEYYPRIFSAIEKLKSDLKSAQIEYCDSDAKNLVQETETFRAKCQAAIIECEQKIELSNQETQNSYTDTTRFFQTVHRFLSASTAAINYAFLPFSINKLEDQPPP